MQPMLTQPLFFKKCNPCSLSLYFLKNATHAHSAMIFLHKGPLTAHSAMIFLHKGPLTAHSAFIF
jgi:hypothetical protein